MKRVCGAIAAFALVGGAALSQDAIESYRLEMDNYLRCNIVTARKIAKQEGDPVSLARAARGMCGQEDAAFRKALLRRHPAHLARKIMDRARARVIESNAAAIVRERMEHGSLPKRELMAWKDCRHQSDHDRAIRGCTLLLEILPPNAKRDIVFALRGKARASKDQHKDAIADFDRAIELSPGRAGYHDLRGKSYVLMGQPYQALDDFDLVIAIDPLSDVAYHNRAFAYYMSSQDDRAIQDLNQAIRLKPDESLHYVRRGDIYAEKGEIEKASLDYEKALALPASTPEARKEQEALRARLAGPEKKFEALPPKPATPEFAFRHGVVRRAPSSAAIAPFSVKTSPGASYFIKLVRPSDGREQIAGFVVGGQPFSTKVPTGTYELRYAVGQDWIDEQEYFGPKTAFYKADRLLTFSVEGDQVRGSEVELILQRGGNLRTSTISKDKF